MCTTQESKEELLAYIQEIAQQYRDIGVTASDRIVALSTCQDSTTNGRVILVGRISTGA
jgi:sortase B